MNYKKLLFSTGILAIFFYVIHVLIGGYLWKEYNHLQQPISDLTATAAPNRVLLSILASVYGIFALIFAISFTIFESRKHHKLVFWGGVSFILMHLVSISYGFFPQDLPGSDVTFIGTMHLVVTGLIVPFTIFSPILIGFGFRKEKSWNFFGIYSVISGFLILIFGSLCAVFFVNKLPYFGLVERINIGILQVWTLYFSLKLVMSKQ